MLENWPTTYCPKQPISPYFMVGPALWWQKGLPELCTSTSGISSFIHGSLKPTCRVLQQYSAHPRRPFALVSSKMHQEDKKSEPV